MWKIVIGFVVFAAIALAVISKSGGEIDMGGEKHSGDIAHPPTPAAMTSLPASAPLAAPAADPASAPSSAVK